MYELATETASYRQREVSHDEMLHTIIDTSRKHSVSFAVLHRAQKNDSKLRRLYRLNLQMRRAVREYSGNKIIPL